MVYQKYPPSHLNQRHAQKQRKESLTWTKTKNSENIFGFLDFRIEVKDGASVCGNPDKSGHKMDVVIMTLLIRPSFQPSPPSHFLPPYLTVALFYEVY